MGGAGAQSLWRIGENVPWTAPWSGENQFRLRPSRAFPGKVEVIQLSAPGVGEPELSGMHVMRQREGVTKLLCHVCGKATTAGDRWLFPAPTGVFVTASDGSERYASHLPPSHGACAKRAQKLCPHLRTTYAQPVRFPSDAGRLRCETNAPPGMHALAASLKPGVEPVFSYFRVYGAPFSRLVRRLRDDAAVMSSN
jgi:hypothetical protein